MSKRRVLTSIAVAALLSAGALPARAQDDPRKAQSTPFFEEGLRLSDKGQNAEALEKFQKAHGYYPSPNTLFNIARMEHLLGRRLEAMAHYREALRNPVLLPQNASRAKQYVVELERVLARVTVTGPAGTKIIMAGKELRLPLDEALDVEPGTVIVKADHDGAGYEGKALAVAGEVVIVELRATNVRAPLPPPPGPVTEPPREPPPEGTFWGWRSYGGLALAGAGAVVLGVGIGFKVDQGTQGSRASMLDARVPPNACSGSNVSADCTDLRAAQQTHNDDKATGNTLAAIGAAGVVAGGVLLVSAVVWPHRARVSGLRVVPMAGPKQAGLGLSSSF